MSGPHRGAVRLTYRRLRSASGAADLDLLEERIAALGEAADENTALGRPLATVLDRVEASLVPLLLARDAADSSGEAPGPGVEETVNQDMAPGATGE